MLAIKTLSAPPDKQITGTSKRIGTFGIGSVAVFPYCEKVIVLTKKSYS
jgi:hypothetical protein